LQATTARLKHRPAGQTLEASSSSEWQLERTGKVPARGSAVSLISDFCSAPSGASSAARKQIIAFLNLVLPDIFGRYWLTKGLLAFLASCGIGEEQRVLHKKVHLAHTIHHTTHNSSHVH
jgi:hypothetical protein